MRPSKSVSDGVRVYFMSLFCRLLRTLNIVFFRQNHGLQITLVRSETYLEGRMRALENRQTELLNVLKFV